MYVNKTIMYNIKVRIFKAGQKKITRDMVIVIYK